MRNFILGFLLAYSLLVVGDYTSGIYTTGNINKFVTFHYITDPFLGNCQEVEGENGHGWKFIVADYYSCDKFQRLLSKKITGK